MVVNIIAHMVHSPPIQNVCFVSNDIIIIINLWRNFYKILIENQSNLLEKQSCQQLFSRLVN